MNETGADRVHLFSEEPNIDTERLAAAGDAMVTAFNVVGPQFVARGFAPNFVEQLTNAVKALREAIDQRSAQVAKRTGTTAAMQEEGDRCVQLGRVIDTLVRPVIKTDPELLAAWENLLILPSPRRLRDAWRVTRGAWRDSSGAPRTFAMQRLPS